MLTKSLTLHKPLLALLSVALLPSATIISALPAKYLPAASHLLLCALTG